ncbi:hypothetical protein CKA32_006601 [Geitlerinema sp. FC II]|nr:hypothetical protein CKA32_006601 [Geitlerinema sp. FC II]
MLGLAIAPPMNGSVAEVQPTPNSYFYKSEMHPFPSRFILEMTNSFDHDNCLKSSSR